MQINASIIGGDKTGVQFDRIPDLCPICLHSVQSLQIADGAICYDPGNPSKGVLQIAYRCPRHKCAALFIAQYAVIAGGRYDLSKLMPQTPKPADFDESISNVSPAFIKIYDQAAAAETAGLDEIAGVGFRKALEFLIKDYCVSKHPDKADQIKASFLGVCIKDFVNDANLKKCSERATWLGNDETHYVRVWTGHDIEDLKRLIRLSVNWIANEVLTEQYFTSMPKS